MKLATRIFLAVFWFFMGTFFFVMFSIHGIKGDLAPVVALLGMTVFGLGFLYAACYCLADLAKYVYSRVREDFNRRESGENTPAGSPEVKALEKPTKIEKPSIDPEAEKRKAFLKRSELQAIANTKALYREQP